MEVRGVRLGSYSERGTAIVLASSSPSSFRGVICVVSEAQDQLGNRTVPAFEQKSVSSAQNDASESLTEGIYHHFLQRVVLDRLSTHRLRFEWPRRGPFHETASEAPRRAALLLARFRHRH